MKYKDLIKFDPIQNVIKLTSSVDLEIGRELVATYVISDRMADVITKVAFPQLQFDHPQDNKALLLVGNYGSGKSHLLSLISTIAERAELVQDVRHPQVREKSGVIAGRFKVIRIEIGSTTMALRNFMCEAIQVGLQQMGVNFVFRPMSEVWENKRELSRMMDGFQKKFPDHGLLLVVDELLDYLRSRDSQALPLDLGFLREIGEVCGELRLRFIGGLQESLFESPQFQFAADSLNRVKDRFAQFRIAREDLAFVVSERLLKKSPEQKALVREHLSGFTALFGNMQERLESYVDLFPVHPNYLEVFERVRTGEKRQALASVAAGMKAILDQDVPTDQPGLLTYDAYWSEIKENAGYRSDPTIGKVIKCAETIEARVVAGFTSPVQRMLLEPARRIVHALGVQRLTDGDIFAPVGVTSDQLRDELTLLIPGNRSPNANALRSSVETILRNILTTVSGQFISHNPENGQYFLDVQKDIDFDAQIRARIDTISHDTLNRYYFAALANVMESPNDTYVPGSLIWEHELVWAERNSGRPGYLFFGDPKQRDTAHPPREFYIYFIRPFGAEPIHSQSPEEVFILLARRDNKFEEALRHYAAASEMALSSGSYRNRYEERANLYLKNLNSWLRDNLPSACDVTYQGTTKRLMEWGRSSLGSRSSLRDLINGVASACLSPRFKDVLENYPRFPNVLTRETRRDAARDAILWLAGNRKNVPMAITVLSGLELLDGDQLRVRDQDGQGQGSRFATYYFDELIRKGVGQALNRSEMLASEHNNTVVYDRKFRLEPELLAVVLVSLVAAENVTLAIPGKKYDASSLAELARVPITELMEFKHLERPRDFDTASLKELFRLLGLHEGLALALTQGSAENQNAAVQQFLERAAEWLKRVLAARHSLMEGLFLWDTALLEALERSEGVKSLDSFKEFLDGLTVFNTPARFKNLKPSSAEISAHHGTVEKIKRAEAASKLVAQLAPKISYLQSARAGMPDDHDWVKGYEAARGRLPETIASMAGKHPGEVLRSLEESLDELKAEYARVYVQLHLRQRLNLKGGERKNQLLNGETLKQLHLLTGISQLPNGHLTPVVQAINSLPVCWKLTVEELKHKPSCPHPKCQFLPVNEVRNPSADMALESYEREVESLLENWTGKLLADLEDPVVREERLPLLSATNRDIIERFLAQRSLPEPLTHAFVSACNEALADLVRVSLLREKLYSTFVPGSALTLDRFRAQFEQLVVELTKGKDQKKVRIVLE